MLTYAPHRQMLPLISSFTSASSGPHGSFRSATAVTRDVRVPVRALDDDEIRERMSGNICRCGAYVNIVAAVRDAAGRA